MSGVNISRSEAQERSAHLAIQSYNVTIDVTSSAETFISKTIAHFTCNKPGYDTFIDAVGKRIIAATLNGAPVDFSNFDGESLFLKNLAATNELIIEIEAVYSKNGEGLQRSVDPADNEVYLYSQGETAHIRRMYPCFDQPDLKATYELTTIVPSHWEVISNSPVKSSTDIDGSKSIWQFLPTPRISTYITAFIAGPYSHVHDEYNGSKKIPLGIYCRKSLADKLDAAEIFTLTKQGFDYFEKVFGLAYPFEKYDQIAVVDFNWGAMENSGAVTFREDLLVFRSKVTERMYSARANIILHEMAHMWFGNMVTMKWWDDLWLNESFAEWSSHLASAEGTKFIQSWTEFNSERKNWAYRQDQLSSTHPIAADMVDIETVNSNFDGITYAKGASVLQQLVAHVGRDNFIEGLKKYFAKHAWKNTTLQDLLVELEATSGRDLTPWVATWLQTSGVNTMRPVLEISGDTYISVGIAQEVPAIPAGSSELRMHRLAVGLYDNVDGKIICRRTIELDVSGALTFVPELAGEKIADLLLINDRDLTYTKIRFDDRSIATLKRDLGKITDSLTRALCWSTAWDMTRDAEISASDFVDIALAGLPAEKEITTVTIVLTQISTALDLFATSAHRDALKTKAADAYYSILAGADKGSDIQLQLTRGFANVAHTSAQNEKLQGILNGAIAGLDIDTDLRWLLLIALVERGVLGQSDLDAQLNSDKTKTGEESHAMGMAAIPTKAAKQAAWQVIISDDTSNAVRLAVIRGFQRASQRDLISQFADTYFAELLDIWSKGFEVGSTFVELMYPVYATEQSTLDKTDAWLNGAGKDSPVILQRYVLENKDSLARALRAQARDA